MYCLYILCMILLFSSTSFFFVKDDYEEERQTNLSAVIASLQLWDRKNMVRLYDEY